MYSQYAVHRLPGVAEGIGGLVAGAILGWVAGKIASAGFRAVARWGVVASFGFIG
jgi:hypothetical protein